MRPHASIGLESANTCHSNRSAFTRAELIATLGAAFLCAAILLPSLASTGSRSEQVGCLSNLRQIGIAFQTWGNEHDDQRPWLVFRDVNGGNPLMNNAWFHFTALSNYITPTLLSDPGERVQNKRIAENWSFSPAGGFMNAGFRDNALSYMLGVHALPSEPDNILAGDRNVFFNGVGGCAYGFAQVLRLDFLPATSFRGWTNGNHGSFGNVLLNDGRAEFAPSERLRLNLRMDGTGAPHFLAPFN